jgi:hypothetical protein
MGVPRCVLVSGWLEDMGKGRIKNEEHLRVKFYERRWWRGLSLFGSRKTEVVTEPA